MNILKQWPKKFQQILIESYGDPVFINNLKGINPEGGCYRFGFPGFSCIVKQMTRPQEYYFYKKCAPYLQEFTKHIPVLYGSFQQENSYWIVIEDVPYSLPRERWYADDQVIEALFRLHTTAWEKSLPFDDVYIPKWDNELTETVLGLYSGETGSQLQPLFFKAQAEAQQLFEPHCWISADTNPTNWGVREDSTVVLFDWERISLGSPAIDLAITMPGLGTVDYSTESQISRRYLAAWSKHSFDFPYSEQRLAQMIKLAKLWSVIEFLANLSSVLDPDTLHGMLSKLKENLYGLEERDIQ